MKFIKNALALGLMLSGAITANAQTTAIVNAKIHTLTDAGTIENASIIIEDGKISQINPADVTADITIDAKGQVLTPGLFGLMNNLGLVEVGAVSRTRDAYDKKAEIDFDASVAFNPYSTAIPYARKGGITRSVVAPSGGDKIFKGLAFAVDLSGELTTDIQDSLAVIVDVRAKSKGSRAISMHSLSKELKDAAEKLNKKSDKKDKDAKKDKKPSAKETLLAKLVQGKLPLVVKVDRASDILRVLALKDKYALDLVLWGAQDAVVVAEEIASADVPVLMQPMQNLPGSFDSLHNSLSNAGKLSKSGIQVAFLSTSAHNMYQLRFDAGNAVANGMDMTNALKASSYNIADIFNLQGGRLAVGQPADMVLWSGDPLELSTRVSQMWIDGVEVGTESRQDKLRERYRTKTDMPHAYSK